MLEQFHSDAVALPRFRTRLLIVFAGLTAALATGVYGSMSYAAAHCRAQMAVRIRWRDQRQCRLDSWLGAGRGAAIGLACGLVIASWRAV